MQEDLFTNNTLDIKFKKVLFPKLCFESLCRMRLNFAGDKINKIELNQEKVKLKQISNNQPIIEPCSLTTLLRILRPEKAVFALHYDCKDAEGCSKIKPYLGL